MRTAEALIRLRACAVWSGPPLSANRIIGYYVTFQWKANARMRLRMFKMSESVHLIVLEGTFALDAAHINVILFICIQKKLLPKDIIIFTVTDSYLQRFKKTDTPVVEVKRFCTRPSPFSKSQLSRRELETLFQDVAATLTVGRRRGRGFFF